MRGVDGNAVGMMVGLLTLLCVLSLFDKVRRETMYPIYHLDASPFKSGSYLHDHTNLVESLNGSGCL